MHKRQRLELAAKNLRNPNKDKIFSDGKKFQATPSTKSEYCTRKIGEEYDEDKVAKGNVSSNRSAANVNV